MQSLETLLEPIRHSPRLVQAVKLLQQQIEDERERRSAFYRDMTPSEKVEFIDGEVVMHSPARYRHLDATSLLFRVLSTYADLQKLGSVQSEKCLCVFPRNDYEPDIVFFGREKSATFQPETMKFPVPDMIVEVLSETTEKRDRGVKFEDFASNGVGEYWMVDADEQTVEQYLLKGEDYELHMKSATGILKSTVISGFEIPVEAVFDEERNLDVLRSLM